VIPRARSHFLEEGCRTLAHTAQALSLFFVLFLSETSAQTIRPVIVEYLGQAKGRIELLNDSLVPSDVIVEPRGFRITTTGQVVFQELDPSLHVKLSATSLRIPPKQSRFIFYEAKADRLPAWFVVNCTFVGPHGQKKLNVEIGLPHTVYLIQKDSIEKSDVHILKSTFLSGPPRVSLELENVSSKLTRVTEWQLSSGKVKRTYAGFPLLPLGRRHVEIAWDGPEAPSKLLLRFKRFSVEEPLTTVGQ
jgi:hypothetical protein